MMHRSTTSTVLVGILRPSVSMLSTTITGASDESTGDTAERPALFSPSVVKPPHYRPVGSHLEPAGRHLKAIGIPITSVLVDALHRDAAAAESTAATLPRACPGALPALPLVGSRLTEVDPVNLNLSGTCSAGPGCRRPEAWLLWRNRPCCQDANLRVPLIREATCDRPIYLGARGPSTPDGTRETLDVSVVIITYQRPLHVRQCLDHLRAQRRAPLEMIVVDSSPGGETQQIVSDEYPEVRYAICSAGRGAMATVRNIGFNIATGHVVAFLDDDVFADPDWLERLAEILRWALRWEELAGLLTMVDPARTSKEPTVLVWYAQTDP